MDNHLPTLNDFFAFDGPALPRRRLEALESGKKFTALRERIARDAGGVSWPVAFSELVSKIGDVPTSGCRTSSSQPGRNTGRSASIRTALHILPAKLSSCLWRNTP